MLEPAQLLELVDLVDAGIPCPGSVFLVCVAVERSDS